MHPEQVFRIGRKKHSLQDSFSTQAEAPTDCPCLEGKRMIKGTHKDDSFSADLGVFLLISGKGARCSESMASRKSI